MKLQMHKDSLFAVLLRSPWWISAAVAAGLFLAARLMVPAIYAAFVPLPFVVIAGMAAWRQLRAPSAGRIAERLAALRALPSAEFAAALEAAFRRQGYEVSRVARGAADLELRRGDAVTLVGSRRWKATRTGVEPLRELHAAARKLEAAESIYVSAGDVTDTARAFAQSNRMRILAGAELVSLLPR